jgi:hypothetical protein
MNCELSIGAFLLIALLPYLPCHYPLHIILFLHFLSINHKCTQPFYFTLVYKPVAHKVKVNWNSLKSSSRLCATPATIPMVLWSPWLFHFTRELP